MKRALDSSAGIHRIGPKTSDNSTSTGSHMKRLKRDGSRPKHLRRGASHASSAQEYMKSEWTCDELDLNKQITPLSELAQDKFKLVEELFSIFSILELKEFTPDILKEYSINQLKELCLEELNLLSTGKIKFITEGNDPEDYIEPQVNIDDKAIGDTSDGIQLSVDDNEYSDFLGAENLELRRPKKEVKDAEVQANWSSLESSSSDDSHSDHRDGEGWMNLWKLEQMEILELEMRARAIRMLLKQQEEEGGDKSIPNTTDIVDTDKNVDKNDLNNENKVIESEEQQKGDNNKISILETEEKLESEDNPIDENVDQTEQNKSTQNMDSNKDLIENKIVDKSDQKQELDEQNSSKMQSKEDKQSVLRELSVPESTIDKIDSSQEVVEMNETSTPEEDPQPEASNSVNPECQNENDAPTEKSSPNEEIILVNEEFDEELEEGTIEEDVDNDQTSDNQSIVSVTSSENPENESIDGCEPEVDTKSTDSPNYS